MPMQQLKSTLFAFLNNLFASLISAGIVAGIGIYWVSQNIPSLIAQGVARGIEIIDLQQATSSLAQVATACNTAKELLNTYQPTVATELVVAARKEFAELLHQIKQATVTDYYTEDDVTKLVAASSALTSDRMSIIHQYVGKPKRTVKGLESVNERITKINQLLESIDRQLDQEPYVDRNALLRELSGIERMVGEVRASLDSRQSATLKTLRAIQTSGENGKPASHP